MTERPIPNDVLTLLHERLAGLDELEALLLLRANAPRGWTAAEVAEQLGLPESSSEAALTHLCRASLLVTEGRGAELRYIYRPHAPDLVLAVSSLAEIYGERTLEVMRVLSNSALDRIRSAAARTFADAFLIGRNGRKQGG